MVGRKPSPLIPNKRSVTKKKTSTHSKKKATHNEDEEWERYVGVNGKKTRSRRGFRPSAPQQQLSAEDKRAMRRRRLRRRAILRVAIVAAVGTLAVMAWLNWDVVAPEKLWTKMQDMMSGGVGSYPVDLSGTGARRLEQIDNYTVVLTDSHLIYLNEEGAEVSRYGCAYADALLRAQGKYVLAAEQKGNRLLLTTRNKVVLETTTEARIRSVALNSHGQLAVLTDGSQGYAVQLQVLDKNGDVLYTRKSNRTATDVALSPDGSTVSLVSVEAMDGNLSTRLEVYALTSGTSEAQILYTEAGLLYRAEYLSNGTLAAVSAQGVLLMDPTSGKTLDYKPEGMHVLGYAVGGDTIALALRPFGDTAGGDVEVLSSAGAVKSSVPFTGEFRHLSGYKGKYTLLTEAFVQPLTASGAGEKIEVEADGHQAVYAGTQAIVMGLNRLEAYDVGK